MIIVLGNEPQPVRETKSPLAHFVEFISIPYPKSQPNSMPQFSDREKHGSDF